MKTKRMLLTITYKNGNQIKKLINYLHFENDRIFFTVDKQIQNVIEEPVVIKLENIDHYDLEAVECEGWDY